MDPGRILPASFPGSAAKRKSDTEDALAIVNRLGRPHLFITVTMNANWPEIQNNLLPHQSAYDRPDLCSRVFRLKLKEIMKELKSGKVFGPYKSHLSVIEWQKRGFPHAHIVVTFQGAGPQRLNQLDKWVWARIPDKSIANGELREKVLKYMIHKPCGAFNVNSPCMQLNRDTNRKKCNKHFPQPFRSSATINDKTGRVEYTRIKKDTDKPTVKTFVNGKLKVVEVGDEWVASYNPYLLMRFDCHIHVDVVTATACIKYLFKYCHKQECYARARIQGIHDEIELYRKSRYISAGEAVWRLLGYHILDRNPAVTKLHAHLEGEQYVLFPANATQEQRLEITNHTHSPLMEYFARPSNDCFDHITILDYFEQYTVTRPKKDDPPLTVAPPGKFLDAYNNVVSKRRDNSIHVCRIVFQNAAVGDLFYLRLLLHKIPGRSFQEMRTVPCPENGEFIHETFHDAARARGFITGDEEYSICMEEASNFQVGSELRALFVTLILDGAPAPKLWTEFRDGLIEDLKLTRTIEEATQQALCEIDLKLQMHGKSNTMVNLPAARHTSTELQRMRKAFNSAECAAYADLHEKNLTSEQQQVYSTVVNSVRCNDGKAYIIDARAGTGKTYTQKCIAARLRGQGKVVLIVASTGIAALQLPGGWTAHSMFKLPMDDKLTPSCVCNIQTQTQRAELIRNADLIIWDELPMTHRYCVEALDRSLRDVTKKNQLFGGKTILFSGDWRQIGPISKGDSPTEVVDIAFISSPLWPHFNRFRLTKSQRDKNDPEYASFVQNIGEGKISASTMPDGRKLTPLNNHYEADCDKHFQLQSTTDFDTLINFVYPDMAQDTRQWNQRAILATTNATIDTCNDHISSARQGQSVSFFSSDSLISDESNPNTAFADPEHLNQLNVSGVPPYELKLKTNTLAMIMRNVNFSSGLVNGQKCVLHAVNRNSRVIQAELLTEEKPHPIVFVPRINFTATVGKRGNGISFSRVQFPLRTAYSITINKSQGQTLSRIGLDLRSAAFAHGQLYVALSRAQNKASIMCLLPPSNIVNDVPHTDNIVYAPFIEAATGVIANPPPNIPPNLPPAGPPPLPPPPPPQEPYWLFQNEIGDGACGFRAIARHVLGDPELHLQVRQQVVQYMSDNRHHDQLGINEGINMEYLYDSRMSPSTYHSYDDYLIRMSSPHAYMGEPEIAAARAVYGKQIHVHLADSTLPAPEFATTDEIHLRFTAPSRHYDTYQLIVPDPASQSPSQISGGHGASRSRQHQQ